jgi:hypothetical protein
MARITLRERLKTDLSTLLIGAFSTIMGLLFFGYQTRKLFDHEAAKHEMTELPFGEFDWGYVWSDTLIAGPILLIGGLLLLIGRLRGVRLGRLLVFAGLSINIYAMIFLWVGFAAVGEPIPLSQMWSDIVIMALCVVSIVTLAVQTMRADDGLRMGSPSSR